MKQLSNSAKVLETKFIAGNYFKPVTMIIDTDRIYFKFGYNKHLLEEIKAMDGTKWHGYDDVNPKKMWSVKLNQRNLFNIEYLMGKDVYKQYKLPLVNYSPTRDLYNHQVEAVRHMITRRHCIYGGEMGVGKTLAAIETMEHAMAEGVLNWLWVGPRSAINAVKAEFHKWDSAIIPVFSTYASLSKTMLNLDYIPQGVVFDECSRIKNPSAQRSNSALDLANQIRDKWKDKSYVILMSGTPAPKNPCDWWMLCEVACPGYLKEGNINKFKNRLAVIESRESLTGGVYPALVTWKNDPSLCDKCGRPRDDERHCPITMELDKSEYHSFVPSINEVEALGNRLRGLTLVHFKKDCLDLPDKIYRIITCKISDQIKRAMSFIKQTAPTTIQALTLLRELSDGFQYKMEPTGHKIICDRCRGRKEIEDVDLEECEKRGLDVTNPTEPLPLKMQKCSKCEGTGKIDELSRKAVYVGTPKEAVLKDVLDEHEDIGRLVVSAGFTGSIDRIVEIVEKEGWYWCRIDGRGWANNLGLQESEMLEVFQSDSQNKICWIMHPESGGMGVTLTASPTILVYSNDFKAENRIQMEDRIHRPGMDNQRGATIIDIDYLPTDQLVRENLQQKKDLQRMSMERLKSVIEEVL